MSSFVLLLVPQEIQQILGVGVASDGKKTGLANMIAECQVSTAGLEPLNCQLLRFLTHLVICLQRIEPDLPVSFHCDQHFTDGYNDSVYHFSSQI